MSIGKKEFGQFSETFSIKSEVLLRQSLEVLQSTLLDTIDENPEIIDADLDKSLSIYVEKIIPSNPKALRKFTPIRAGAICLINHYRNPLLDHSKNLPKAQGEVLANFTDGIQLIATGLLHAEGSVVRGVQEHTMLDVQNNRGTHVDYIFNLKVNTLRAERLNKDKTGWEVVLGEYSDISTLSEQGKSPYFESVSDEYRQIWDPVSIKGAAFGVELYRRLYPAAVSKFGDGVKL